MADAAQLCKWMTCQRNALPDGFLCRKHLSEAMKGKKNLRGSVTEIATALGMGVAGNALYSAISMLFTNVSFIVSYDARGGGEPKSMPSSLAEAMRYLRSTPNEETLAAALREIEAHGLQDDVRRCFNFCVTDRPTA
jgi:hypothetical protein